MESNTKDEFGLGKYPARKLSPEEKAKVVELKQLPAWKKFAKKANYKSFRNFEIKFENPVFGIAGRASTDRSPKRFEKIPDVLEFFGKNGDASRYFKQNFSAWDVLLLYNFNFDNNPFNDNRPVYSHRDFFPEEHLTVNDFINILDNKHLRPDINCEMQTKVNEKITESVKVIEKRLEKYKNDKMVVGLKRKLLEESDETLICMHCKGNVLGLSVICCDTHKPICLTCVVALADKIYKKWLFVPSRIPCCSDCTTGVQYPIVERQVIPQITYLMAIRISKICKICKRGYDAYQRKHKCLPADKSMSNRAQRPYGRIRYNTDRLSDIFRSDKNIPMNADDYESSDSEHQKTDRQTKRPYKQIIKKETKESGDQANQTAGPSHQSLNKTVEHKHQQIIEIETSESDDNICLPAGPSYQSLNKTVEHKHQQIIEIETSESDDNICLPAGPSYQSSRERVKHKNRQILESETSESDLKKYLRTILDTKLKAVLQLKKLNVRNDQYLKELEDKLTVLVNENRQLKELRRNACEKFLKSSQNEQKIKTENIIRGSVRSDNDLNLKRKISAALGQRQRTPEL